MPGADSTPLEHFARCEAGPLYGLFVRATGDAGWARDLLQDTLMYAWRNRASYDPARPFRSWIFRIGQNRLRNFLRRRRLEREWLKPLEADPCGELRLSASEALEREEILERALLRLPGPQRVALLLRYREGFSCAEIGEVLDMTPNAVSIQLHHARKSLKKILGKEPLEKKP